MVDPLALEVFSGAGGASIGIHNAGYRSIGMDNWKWACATRAYNGMDTIQADLQGYDWKSLQHLPVKLLWGSPPCQSFSRAGHNYGGDDLRDCIPDFIDAIRILQPPLFVMENVPNLAAPRHHDYFQNVLHRMEGAGYQVSWKILDAAHFGVPQTRRRIFVVGKLDGGLMCWPEGDSPNIPIREALGDLLADDLRYFGTSMGRSNCRYVDVDVDSASTLTTSWTQHHAGFCREIGQDCVRDGGQVLTIEQGKILQGFPWDFVVVGPKTCQETQLGNSVPPPLAEAVVRNLEVDWIEWDD